MKNLREELETKFENIGEMGKAQLGTKVKFGK